jgi:hypothetical protein
MFPFIMPMAAGAVGLGLLSCRLSRREIARIERELVYPRERPMTLDSWRLGLIGLALGTLTLIDLGFCWIGSFFT